MIITDTERSEQIMFLFNKIREILQQFTHSYAVLLSNGIPMINQFSTDQLQKIQEIWEKIYAKIPLQEPFVQLPWVFYKITPSVFVVMSIRMGKSKYTAALERLQGECGQTLSEVYEALPVDFGDLITNHLFAMVRASGPEPIASLNIKPDCEFCEEERWKYSMTSLMLFVNQNKTKRNVLTFHPFIDEKQLGIVFLFQINLEGARGGAYDASILTLFDYNHRHIAYRFEAKLELIYHKYSKRLASAFIENYSRDIDAPIEKQADFVQVLKSLHKELEEISLEPTSPEHLRDIMIGSLTEIKSNLYGE